MIAACWLYATIFALLTPSAGEVPGERQPAVASVDPLVMPLIGELDDDRYAIRRAAERKLAAIGRPAVEPLRTAAEGGSLELSIRAISALESIYTNESTSNAGVAAAEEALFHLKSSKTRSVAGRAHVVLESNYDIVEKRAVADIRNLGGVVEYHLEQTVLQQKPRNSDNVFAVVRLGTTWKGADAGLKHVKKLTRLSTLYFIDGVGVSEEGLNSVKAALPNVNIQYRGQAFLGISGLTHAQGCFVRHVKEGSAADKGGMRLGDIIANFNGETVEGFDGLIESIKKRKPGDKVKLKVLRAGQLVDLQVQLTGW